MTVDLLTFGETMGLLDTDRIGPMRLGGPVRLSMAGAESNVAIGVARLADPHDGSASSARTRSER